MSLLLLWLACAPPAPPVGLSTGDLLDLAALVDLARADAFLEARGVPIGCSAPTWGEVNGKDLAQCGPVDARIEGRASTVTLIAARTEASAPARVQIVELRPRGEEAEWTADLLDRLGARATRRVDEPDGSRVLVFDHREAVLVPEPPVRIQLGWRVTER
jgi:hypothetical protein